MSDQEIADYIRDKCSRRISFPEFEVCDLVGDEITLNEAETVIWESLKNRFEDEMEAPTQRETPDEEGASLL